MGVQLADYIIQPIGSRKYLNLFGQTLGGLNARIFRDNFPLSSVLGKSR
jgi:hypothetical protein